MDWLKDISKKYFTKEQNIVSLTVILIIGIIIVIASGSFFKDNKKNTPDSVPLTANTNLTKAKNTEDTYGDQLENKLESILSQIEGVGKVSVMITFYSGSEIVPAIDTRNGETVTEESDNQGGNRKITATEKENKTLIINEQGGHQKPLILKELQPAVKGVIVAAEGAADLRTKSNICEAVKTALGIPAHKVQVFVKLKN
ncbi:MAG: stage sporulation protein [Clostridia bacterium]|jgi:stage III sporulation protein AG|uniref:stage III sporulation protein AG n=1 Tax=Petroclostridium xylanilyticum TaxID=1792311 RepID=UPI000B98BFA4|nr:stage III sporulation protein AG [Petroclostridium xylanilyticum]MBZ4644738.1 stage sporulation protein [Clostridia bacterium]